MNMIVWSKAQELSDAGAVNEAQVQIAMLAYAMQILCKSQTSLGMHPVLQKLATMCTAQCVLILRLHSRCLMRPVNVKLLDLVYMSAAMGYKGIAEENAEPYRCSFIHITDYR